MKQISNRSLNFNFYTSLLILAMQAVVMMVKPSYLLLLTVMLMLVYIAKMHAHDTHMSDQQ